MSDKKFGGSGITEELFNWISDNIPVGSVVVELGAGDVSTKYLSERYELYSVENDPRFCGRWLSTYIYAPIIDGWYDTNILKAQLPQKHKVLLIDGPVGTGNRDAIINHLDLFDSDAIIIVDDTHRPKERELLDTLESLTNKQKTLYQRFGVLK